MGKLIAVLSGKGGTGKTSLCAGIASALAQSGERVLCIDCDIGLRNLDISLGLADFCALSFVDVCSGNYPLDSATQHPDFPTLFFLTAPANCTSADIDEERFAAFLEDAKKQYQFILLDAPAGIEAGFRLCAKHADQVILVTGADPASVRDAARAGELLEKMGKTQVRVIVNRVNEKLYHDLCVTVDDVMDRAGLPLLGITPDDPDVTLSAAFEQPLLCYNKRSAAAKACKRIAKRIQGFPEPIPYK
ncbi:MAG: AAA family ATPase [Oscillospiraceae bacterium]|nr:AAA family ATPase [Oscillospiraceae bacterium]